MRTDMQKKFVLPAFLLIMILVAGCVELGEFLGYGENVSVNWTMPQNRTAGLHGIVTDLNKVPLGDVTISVIGDVSNYSSTTDKSGRYNITSIQPGTYDIVVWKAGYKNVTLPNFTFIGGRSHAWNVTLVSDLAGLYGIVRNLKNASLEGAYVLVIGDISNYSSMTDIDGRFNITGILPGTYALVVGKEGYRNATVANFTFTGGRSYPWNVTIARDCFYYPVNASTNYVLRYGYNWTVYRGHMVSIVEYPEGATYSVYPAEDGKLSDISITYRAGNRMLRWKLDNSKGHYSYVKGYIYIDMKGTQTMEVFNRKEMSISEAAKRQAGFLGSETSDEGRTMIDPSDRRIMKIAEDVRSETGSDDVWTVAKALFVWLKNNTEYYHGPESDEYTQSASDVLRSRRGDCDELSYLYISLCRAAGIPARFVKGYAVEKEPREYASHMWVEFYDGEWVPVEVASTENRTYEDGVIRGQSGNITRLVDTRFGIGLPSHVAVFVDDGTSESLSTAGTGGVYYDRPASGSPYTYYDAVNYDQMYIAACADGTRVLVKEKE